MSDILEKLAGNKTVANLAFKQIKKYIVTENISFIVIYVDNNGDISAKSYTEPMAIIKQSDYESLIERNREVAKQLSELIKQVKELKSNNNE